MCRYPALSASMTAGPTSPGLDRNVPYAMMGILSPVDASVYAGEGEERSKFGAGLV